MIEGIATSIIASIVIAITLAVYKKGSIREVLDTALFYIAPTGIRSIGSREVDLAPLQKKLTRLILVGQSRFGIHKGQFGKSQTSAESKKWQGSESKEDMDTKPRMYLTYWPTMVLHRRGLAPRSVALAVSGIERIFVGNRVRVAQAAAEGMPPFSAPVIVSYRHTMAGALILSEFQEWNSITRSVIDAMLDPANEWQCVSGGWKQVSEGFSSEDIWATCYAAKLLSRVLSSSGIFSDRERSQAKMQSDLTMTFLSDQWEERKWAYQKLSSEESAVPVFIDIFPVLHTLDHELKEKCLNHFEKWLSPKGDLSEAYLNRLEGVPREQLRARMAYAFYLSTENSNSWKPLFESVSKGDFEKIYSSELAFVLDMSFAF